MLKQRVNLRAVSDIDWICATIRCLKRNKNGLQRISILAITLFSSHFQFMLLMIVIVLWYFFHDNTIRRYYIQFHFRKWKKLNIDWSLMNKNHCSDSLTTHTTQYHFAFLFRKLYVIFTSTVNAAPSIRVFVVIGVESFNAFALSR